MSVISLQFESGRPSTRHVFVLRHTGSPLLRWPVMLWWTCRKAKAHNGEVSQLPVGPHRQTTFWEGILLPLNLDVAAFSRLSSHTTRYESGSRLVFSARSQSACRAR